MSLSFGHSTEAAKAPCVLIVDESAGQRAALHKLLAGIGCECSEAANGIDAFECIMRGKVDLLITELDLPGMSGVQLLAAIGLLRRVNRPRVIVLSARIEPGLVDRIPELRIASALLAKPVDLLKFGDAAASELGAILGAFENAVH